MKKGDYIVKHDDGTIIYGVTQFKLYRLIGVNSNDCYVIENNSGELIAIHKSRAELVIID